MTRARSGRRERNVGRGAGARATRPGPATPATGASVGRLSPRWRDPADLTPAERLADLGALLATGYRRARLRERGLAESGGRERPCDPVDTEENA